MPESTIPFFLRSLFCDGTRVKTVMRFSLSNFFPYTKPCLPNRDRVCSVDSSPFDISLHPAHVRGQHNPELLLYTILALP